MRFFFPFFVAGVAATTMPKISLDYCTLQAAEKLTDVDVYKYQNIRFAAPVTSSLRFKEPQPPLKETSVNNGSVASSSVTCKSTEDCLFLDVYAPKGAKNLPVWVHSYGGGFTGGSKNELVTDGLYALNKNFVTVSYNYRLGITGLANGPTYQHEGGVSNLCVWDAEAVFKWVKKYISKFGGNPSDVTATGFSAGASQVLFQMTRFGGRAEQLFTKAFLMSPGYVPGAGHYKAEAFWQDLGESVGCSGGQLDCMRSVDFDTLTTAGNTVAAKYTQQTFQPRVDGFMVPDTYEANLYQGHFNFSGPCVLSHGLHEANTQTFSGVNTDADVATELRTFFTGITDGAVNQLLELFPASDYASPGLRFSDMKQSFDLTAKNLAATHALKNQTWNAKHLLGGGTHGGDQSYYFYSNSSSTSSGATSAAGMPTSTGSNSTTSNATIMAGSAADGMMAGGGMPSSGSVNATLAVQLQKYLVSFILTGNPNKLWPKDKPYWPLYNEQASGIVNFFNTSGITTGDDDLANAKSLFFNKALWY